MKKIEKIIAVCILAIAAVSFIGCQGNTQTDDTPEINGGGNNGGGNNGGGNNGGGGGSTNGWQLCKHPSYEIFNLQIWAGGGQFDMEQQPGLARFTVQTYPGWMGGGLIRYDESKLFDFTGVSKMVFKIRGTIKAETLCFGVQSKTGNAKDEIFPMKTSLKNHGYSVSENAWTSVELDISAAASKDVINAFMLIAANDWGGAACSSGDWFEIKDLDWVDGSGKSVTLRYK